MTPPTDPPTPDRRAPRRRVLLTGIVTYNDGAISFRCTIRDRSEHGARLKLPAGIVPPPEVWLIEVTEAIAYRAHIVWRLGEQVGVELREPLNIRAAGGDLLQRQLHALWLAAAAS